MLRRIQLPILLCAALACGKPDVAPGLDVLNCPADGGACALPPSPGVISGSVVYSGTVRGDVVILLFDKASLPPPDGTGTSAVAVARVAQSTLFASATPDSIGPFSAPYTFTQVPANRSYQIRAFIDATHEFDPFFDFAQQPRAGDPAGGYGAIDPATGQPRLLFLSIAPGQAVEGINIAFPAKLAFDPPSFEFSGELPALDQASDRPQHLRLHAVNLGVQGATFTRAHFGLELDRDPCGNRRSTGGDGLDDVFPKVFLRQLTMFDENAREVAVTDAAVIPARVVPIAQLPLLLALAPGADPLPSDMLDVLIEPFALRLATLEPLPVVPKGKYQVVVVERSGQVWTLPNSLGDPRNNGTPYYAASQALSVRVDDKLLRALPGGSVSGNVVFQGGTGFDRVNGGCTAAGTAPAPVPPNIIVQAYLDDPLNPPPPLGAALPVRVAIIRGTQVVPTATGFTAPYTLTGLAFEQKYTIEALADVAGTFSPLDLLQTPVRGDLLGGAIDLSTGLLAPVLVHSSGSNTQDVTLSPQPVPLDAPVFQIDDAAGPASMPADQVAPVRFGVLAAPLAFPIAAGTAPVFTVSLVRDPLTGQTVDADGDGLPDVWPRVFLVALDPKDPTDLTQQVPTRIIPAAVDPTPFLAALKPQQARPAVPPLLTGHLPIIVRPVLVDAATRARHNLAPSKYKIVIINQTGQVWQIPNEAGPAALDPRAVCAAAPCAPGTVQTQSQGRAFVVGLPTSTPTQVTISGTLTFTSPTPAAGAYVYAFSTANPPPPLGTGTPVSADYHPASELTGGSVPFSLPNLIGGQSYFVTAVVDTRGDYAVAPTLYAAAPGEGTLVAFAPAPVAAGSTGLNLAASTALPPRPSFTVVNGKGEAFTSDLSSLFPDAITPQRIALHATPVLTAALTVTPEAHAPIFPVSYRACDANGAPVDVDSDGLPGLYPKITVVKLADADATGLTIDPNLTVIPARVDPTPFIAQLGACSARAVVPATDLSVLLAPAAVQFAADGTPMQVAIPKGRYGIVLTSSTGQVWRLPNELAPAVPSQGVAIAVAAQVPAAQGGSISGTVHLSGYTDAQVGNLVVAAYAAAAPPPPNGLGRPLAVQLIPARFVRPSVSASAVNYALNNLAPGTYLVTALLDPLDRFSALLDFLSTPPLGAQVSFSPAPIPVGSAPVTGKDLSLSRTGQPAIPFERPAFALDASSTLTVSSAAPSAAIKLDAATPAGLPYAAGPAMFHPTLAICGASGKQIQNPSLTCTPGLPYPDTGKTCAPGGAHPWVSSQVYVTPIDTGSRLVAAVVLDACQFCPALTGTADCSAAPLMPPNGPLPLASISFAVADVAIDPATATPAGQLPPGHYAITVIEPTGQSWTVPNGLAAAAPSQGAVVTVAP
jgi:hypothetical protein